MLWNWFYSKLKKIQVKQTSNRANVDKRGAYGRSKWGLPQASLTIQVPGSARSPEALGRRWFPGEGHGNSLQYSCMENPMDKVAWWATVHSVVKSWTRLKWLSKKSIKKLSFTRCFSSRFLWNILEQPLFNLKFRNYIWMLSQFHYLLYEKLSILLVIFNCLISNIWGKW